MKMNMVYFSNIEDKDSWMGSGDSGGILKVWVVPKKWWSIKEWKIAREFSKDFGVSFLKEE